MAGDLYLAIATIIEQIGRGQLSSEDHAIELTKRSRDLTHLQEMMATIDSSVVDQLTTCRDDVDYIPAAIDHWLFFSELVSASRFRFYDDRLTQIVTCFKSAWEGCAYAAKIRFKDVVLPLYYHITTPVLRNA